MLVLFVALSILTELTEALNAERKLAIKNSPLLLEPFTKILKLDCVFGSAALTNAPTVANGKKVTEVGGRSREPLEGESGPATGVAENHPVRLVNSDLPSEQPAVKLREGMSVWAIQDDGGQ